MSQFGQSLIKLSSSVVSEQQDWERDLTVTSSFSFKFSNKEFCKNPQILLILQKSIALLCFAYAFVLSPAGYYVLNPILQMGFFSVEG